jgi:hypothetical protein
MGDGSDATLTHDGTTGITIAANPITITSATAATWSTSAGALTVNGTGGVNVQEGGATIIGISDSRVLSTSNTASIDMDATGAIAVNSSGGVISVANDNVDQNVNLATAGTRTLNIGILDGTDTTTITSKGNQTHSGTITVGVDDTGYDVKFFGATASSNLLWDESADDLIFNNAGIAVGSDATGDVYYRDSSGFLERVGIGSDGQVLTSTGSVPNWEAASSGTALTGSTNNTIATVTGANAIAGEANLTFDGTTLGVIGNAGVGIARTDGTLHVHTATAGSVTANTSYDDLVIENSTYAGITILTPNNVIGSLAFGDPENNDDGVIRYDHSARALEVFVAGANHSTFSDGLLDLITTGTRIDFDTDNDTSIRASADDILSFEVGGQDGVLMSFSNPNVEMQIHCATEGLAITSFYEVTTLQYYMGYQGSSDRFVIWSTDVDGSGGNANVLQIPDGQLTIDGNSTFDDNAFDYVCDGCGRHKVEMFECCGHVEWHDDIELMSQVLHTMHIPEKRKEALLKMESLGVINTNGTLDTDKPELFTSMNRMPWFLMSGMAQMSDRITELENQLCQTTQ